MNKPIPLLLVLLGLWILGTSFWRYNNCCQITASSETAVSTAPIVAPLAPAPTKVISFEDKITSFDLGLYDNLSFTPSQYNYLTPVSDSLMMTFGKVVDYLKTNPNRSIQLTGLYQTDEENKSMLSSLGMGRANQVKKLLVDLGAFEGQIKIADQIKEDIQVFESLFTNAVSFSFFETPEIDENQLRTMAERLKANPQQLYFATDAKTIELNQEQRQFLTDLVTYLSKNPKAIIKSTGHTDDVGDYIRNKYISRKRAEFVRDYLVQNGINEKQIWVFYEGPDYPIADNETRSGRAKNRRVELELK